MLLELSLKNFKTHEQTKLEFSKGVNVLTGIMGSGKTSVLQAIVFALYGDLPEIRSRKMSVSDLIMRKPVRKTSAEIRLKFSKDGSIYEVIRIISRSGTSDARLLRDGKLIEMGSRRVTSKIEELLGMTYDQFVSVIHVRQNEIDNFLRMNKRDRVSIIDEILGINKVEEIKEKLRSIKRAADSNLKFLERYASKDPEPLKKELTSIEEEISDKEKKLDEINVQYDKKLSELRDIQSKIRYMEELKQKKELLEKKYHSLSALIRELEEEISSMRFVEDAKRKYEEIQSRISQLREDIREKSSLLRSLEDQLKEIERIEQEIPELEKKLNLQIEDPTEEIEKLLSEISSIRAEIDLHKRSIKELKGAGATCPVCGAPLKDKESHIRKHQEEIERLNKALQELSAKYFDLKRRKQEYDKMKLQISAVRERLEIYREKLKKKPEIQSRMLSLKEDLPKEMEELDHLEKEQELLREAVEREEKMEKLKKYKKSLVDIESQLSSIIYDEDAYKKLLETKEKVYGELTALKKELEMLPQMIATLKLRRDRLKKEIEEIEHSRKEYLRIKKGLERLNTILNYLGDVQILVRNTFVEAVNSMLSDMWPLLYPYKDYIAVRLKIISEGIRAGDYVLELKDKSGWHPVTSTASGGERTIASLALRIVFSKLLSNLGILLLDEPTHNLDENGIQKLQELLRQGVTELLDQVILITHERSMEKAATGRSYHFARDKERDMPTVVEETS